MNAAAAAARRTATIARRRRALPIALLVAVALFAVMLLL